LSKLSVGPGGSALIGSNLGQECGSGHDQRHVAVPAMPGSCLAVVEAEIVLCAQEAFLDSPAQACCSGHFGKGGPLPGVDKIISNFITVSDAVNDKVKFPTSDKVKFPTFSVAGF
jgi:hypothetical protein